MRYKVPLGEGREGAEEHQLEVELGFDAATAFKEAQRCLNCDVQTVFTAQAVHRVRRLRRHLPDGLHHLHRQRRRGRSAHAAERAGAQPTQDLYVSGALKTGRVMVKDEDVCLHCGLCAERCPTGAWDMQKFLIEMTHAGPTRVPAQRRDSPQRRVRSIEPIEHDAARIEAVNDFVVKFANVNGSGSASANELFAKAILRMGVPVSPRNIFPSNIQGLPTWYEVRVTEHGWLGRRGGVDLMVAMNPQTWDAGRARDRARRLPVLRQHQAAAAQRTSATTSHVIGMPLTEICNATYSDPRQRQLFKNIIYVGALAQLLDIDSAVIEELFGEQYKGKEKLLELNLQRAAAGARLRARAPAGQPIGLRVRARATRRRAASSSKATPPRRWAASTAAPRSAPGTRSRLRRRWPKPSRTTASKFRVDTDTGEHNYAIVQAEDEIASIGMVTGAGWNGARAFTATSGPGMSLMTEFIGLAYFAEIPVTIIDVQRGGPSTGMPTRTQQADLLSCAYASHGDTKHVLLFPARPARVLRAFGAPRSTWPTGCRRRCS